MRYSSWLFIVEIFQFHVFFPFPFALVKVSSFFFIFGTIWLPILCTLSLACSFFFYELICFVCNSISVARAPQCPQFRLFSLSLILSLSSFSNYTLLWYFRQLQRIFQLYVISTFSQPSKLFGYLMIFNFSLSLWIHTLTYTYRVRKLDRTKRQN